MSNLDNPYAPPADDDKAVVLDDDADELQRATQGARFVNLLVDSVASRVLGYTPLVMLGKFSEPTAIFWGFLLSLGYYVVCEGVFQATLGKLLTGTRVVAVGGGRPTFGQVLGRTLARFVPFEPLSFVSGRFPIGWHDKWSHTRVVSLRAPRRPRRRPA
jgi:uncharacterized RDD family membrane protein YckC